MKTTMMFRNIANPRRTTLVHLDDAEGTTGTESAGTGAEESAGGSTGERVGPSRQDQDDQPDRPEQVTDLPSQTANPRRTILMEAPGEGAGAPGETGFAAGPGPGEAALEGAVAGE